MGFFGSKKTRTKPLLLPGQGEFLREGLEKAKPGAFERLSRAGEEYPGDLTAPMTGIEKGGLDTLEGWLNSPLPSEDSLWGLSRGEYEKTLGSDHYDPAEGQYYQAFRTSMARELQEAKDRLAARTSARDQFYTGGRVAGEAEMEEDYLAKMGLVLGGLHERERDRRLGAIPGALNLLGQEEMYPLSRVAGSQQYGGLERYIEQASLDREYQEYMRQMADLGIPLETAMALATFKPDWSSKSSGGEFWDLLNPAAALGGGGWMGGGGGITPTGGGGFQGLNSLAGMGQFAGGLFGPASSQYGVTGGLIGPPTQAAAAGQGLGGLFGGLGGLAGGAAGGLGSLFSGAAGGLGSLGAGLLAFLCDIRFKENIARIEDSLEKVKALDGKTYNYTEAPDVERGGIIAQDLEKVLPEAVKEIQGVKFILLDAVIGLLVNAVKELNEKVERIGA
jgi:hypothetical protein